MAGTSDLHAFIQAFDEAWDEVVAGIPVSVDLFRFREAFGRKVLALVERRRQEQARAAGDDGADPARAAHRPGRLLNEIV